MWRDLRSHAADEYDLSEPEIFELEPLDDNAPLDVATFFHLIAGE
jgi:hypothetical protein